MLMPECNPVIMFSVRLLRERAAAMSGVSDAESA
jgi:hypothetical protein